MKSSAFNTFLLFVFVGLAANGAAATRIRGSSPLNRSETEPELSSSSASTTATYQSHKATRRSLQENPKSKLKGLFKDTTLLVSSSPSPLPTKGSGGVLNMEIETSSSSPPPPTNVAGFSKNKEQDQKSKSVKQPTLLKDAVTKANAQKRTINVALNRPATRGIGFSTGVSGRVRPELDRKEHIDDKVLPSTSDIPDEDAGDVENTNKIANKLEKLIDRRSEKNTARLFPKTHIGPFQNIAEVGVEVPVASSAPPNVKIGTRRRTKSMSIPTNGDSKKTDKSTKRW